MANISWRLTKGDCYDNWAYFSPKNNAPDTAKQENLFIQKLIKIINNNQKTEIIKIIKQYFKNANQAEIEKIVKEYMQNNPQQVDIEDIIKKVIERQAPHETKQTKHIFKNAKQFLNNNCSHREVVGHRN